MSLKIFQMFRGIYLHICGEEILCHSRLKYWTPLFLLLLPVLINAQVTTLYTQNFGTGTAFPAGWSAANSGTWTISTSNSSTTPTFSGNSNAAAGSSNNARTLVYTNNLSTIGYTSITVLWAARKTINRSLTFEWSANGTNWNTLAITDVPNNSTWAWVNGGTGARIALPAGAASATNLSFRWTFDTDGTAGSYRIDDFSVQGCRLPDPPGPITGSADPCAGTSQIYSVVSVAGITYSWVFPADWTQTSGGTTSSVTVQVGSTSGTIRVTPSNSCGNGTESNLNTTVATIPSQPSIISGSVTPCSGSTQNYSVVNTPGVTYNWSLPAGWSISGGATGNSITVIVGNNAGMIIVTPSNSCGNGTASQLAVNPVLSVPAQPGSISGNSTPCLNSTQSYSIPPVAGVTYTWSFPSDWIINSGQGSSSVSFTVGASSGNISVVPSNPCGNGPSASVAISVQTIPAQPGAISSSSAICTGTTIDFSVAAVAGTTYTWAFPADWTILSGQGSNQVTVTIGSASGTVSVTPSNICGSGTSRSLAVTVLSIPSQPSAINGNPFACRFSTQAYSVTAVAGVIYTWTVPSGWTITSGQGTNSILATVGNISGNITVVPSNPCGTGPSQSLAVTVQNAAPSQPSPITGNLYPCSGATETYSVINIPGVTYSWSVPAGYTIQGGQGTNSIVVIIGNTAGAISVSPGNSCGGGAPRNLTVTPQLAAPAVPSDINGNNPVCAGSTQTYTVTAVPLVTYTWTVPPGWIILSGQGTFQITVTIGNTSGSIQVIPSNSCGNGPSKSLSVNVLNSLPLEPGSFIGADSVCEGSNQAFSVSPVPEVTMTWSFPSGWIIVSGQGTSSVNVIGGSTSGNVQVTPSNACGVGPSLVVPIVAIPLPVAPGAITGNSPVCEGTIQVYSVLTLPGLTYTWSVPAGWTILSGQGTGTVSVRAGLLPGNISVTSSNDCGSGVPSTRSIQVNPKPAAYTGANANICVGASIQLGGPAVAGNTYSWSSVPPGFTSNVSNPVVTPTDTTTYILIEVNPTTGCSDTNSVQVLTNQIINVGVNPSSLVQTICTGNNTIIVLSSNITGTVFTWNATLTAGSGTVFNPNGTGNTINEPIINNSSASSQVTYSITATANQCVNANTAVVVTINPAPNVDTLGIEICSREPAGIFLGPSTNGVAAASFSILAIDNGGMTATSGSPGTGTGLPANVIADDAWLNTSSAPVNVLYTIVPVSDQGCSGASFQVKVTVNPEPSVTSSLTQTICSGTSTSVNLSASIPSSFSWSIGTITGGITGATPGSGSSIIQTLSNPSNSTTGTIEYIVTPTASSGTCTGSSSTIIISVDPKPLVTNASTAAICSGDSWNTILTASVNSTFSWTIGAVTGSITGATPGSGGTINQVLLNSSNSNPGSVQYVITALSQGSLCQSDPFTITVTVNPIPAVTATASVGAACPGSLINLSSTSTLSASPTIFTENFNAPSNSWQLTNSSTGGTTANANWTLRPDGYVTNGQTFHSNDASQIYLSDSRSQNGTVTATTLISPVLSTVGYSNLSLSFWHYYDFNSTTGESAKVEVSTNGGSNWSTVATYTNDRGSASGFQNVSLNLGATYINSANFRIRFNYYCGSNRGRYWAIDNVSLSGTPVVAANISWTSIPAGFTSSVANPAGVTLNETTEYKATYTSTVTGCSGTGSVIVTAHPVPDPTISADYCSVPGKIRLTASGGGTYLWNTGETTQVIDVDIAGVYSVVVTNAFGCSSTAYLSVSNELVVNGDFSAGNSGFTSGYAYDPTANGLIAPESEYAVNSNANYNHPNFWGYDHTSGTGTGNANFLIVNGAKYAPQPYVWRQTVAVQPNTEYYFSAWAISLNNVSPYAELRFSVNGVQVGTTAYLTAGQNILNNPWLVKDRFYGTWNSGAATTAVIEILDLNTSANGNDFGLDDISFGTLLPVPFSIDPTCSGSGVFCEGDNVQLFSNISGGKPPMSYSWTGPNGFSSTQSDPVITSISAGGSGRYYLSVTDGYGCDPVVDSVDVLVNPQPGASISGPVSACQFAPSPSLTFTGSSGVSPYQFTYSVNGGASQSGTSALDGTFEVTVPTNVVGSFTYTITLVSSANGCSLNTSISHTVVIHGLPTCYISGNSPVCPGSTGNTYSGVAGMSSYSWSITGNGNITSGAASLNVEIEAGSGCNDPFLLTLQTTDVNGCNALCQEEILVEDINAPVATCPPDLTVQADAGENFASVNVSSPVYTDNCSAVGNIAVSWVMSAPTGGSGNGIIPFPYVFNVGTTTVTYSFIDACGNSTTCFFQVTVTPNDPPEINCASDITANTDPGVCTATLNPGQPVLVSGSLPVTWTWTMSGATNASGSGIPIVPVPYTFNTGVTTIQWVASNISGTDTCYQLITVVDNQPPIFNVPGPFTFCVEDIYTAEYYDPTMDIQPDRPDYYLFEAGSTVFNVDTLSYNDNCGFSCIPELRWRIDFADGSSLPASPALYITGQPSLYPVDIQFPGAVSNNVIHTISYQLTDCNGVVSPAVQVDITITPRPNVIKQ